MAKSTKDDQGKQQAVSASNAPEWHRLGREACLQQLEVKPETGLSTAEVARRQEIYGPNELAEAKKEPFLRAFLRQFYDYMQIMLVVASILSFVIGQISTGVLLLILAVANAIIGYIEEGKAEESVAALKKMLHVQARTRRDGKMVEIPAEQLVPGDIVMFEAGDQLPADGRLLQVATLEIEESALTGESQPVAKNLDPVEGDDVPLGDRVDMAYMNSLPSIWQAIWPTRKPARWVKFSTPLRTGRIQRRSRRSILWRTSSRSVWILRAVAMRCLRRRRRRVGRHRITCLRQWRISPNFPG